MQIINNKIVETKETDLIDFLESKKYEVEMIDIQISELTQRKDAILASLDTVKSNKDVKEVLDVLQQHKDNGIIKE